MTGGPRLSAAAGAVARRWAGGGATGRLGQAAELGCNGEKEQAGCGVVGCCWASWAEKRKDLGVGRKRV
jgi:hypothetical protein